MSERQYRICLCAPLGDREGTLVFHEAGGRVDGWLAVMNEQNRFAGVLSEDGQLAFSGAIRTRISTRPYTATGTIGGRRILLNLKTESGAPYPVFGEEVLPDDDVL